MDTITRGIALRQFKGPVVFSGIPDTTSNKAVNVPVDFHVHCREMRPAFRAILIAIFGAGSAREISPRRVICEIFAVPAIGEINVVAQAGCVGVTVGHWESQAGVIESILLRIWIRTVSCRARELDWLGDALAGVSPEVDSSALQ